MTIQAAVSNMRATPVPIDWHSGISIYASEAFLKTLSHEYGWIGGVDANDQVVCILPYSVIHKSVLRLVRFPVQTILLDEELGPEHEREFLNSTVEYFRTIRSDLIIPATFNALFRTHPDGATVARYGNYIVNLRQPEETLWKNLHPKHRNVIRNAMKKGVTIRTGVEYLETAYRLVLASFTRSARGFIGKLRVRSRMDWDDFKRQVLAFGE